MSIFCNSSDFESLFYEKVSATPISSYNLFTKQLNKKFTKDKSNTTNVSGLSAYKWVTVFINEVIYNLIFFRSIDLRRPLALAYVDK